MLEALVSLAGDPRPPGVKKLGGEDHVYRIRVGNHRAVYDILDGLNVIVVVRIADRKDAYRGK